MNHGIVVPVRRPLKHCFPARKQNKIAHHHLWKYGSHFTSALFVNCFLAGLKVIFIPYHLFIYFFIHIQYDRYLDIFRNESLMILDWICAGSSILLWMNSLGYLWRGSLLHYEIHLHSAYLRSWRVKPTLDKPMWKLRIYLVYVAHFS